MFRSLIKIFEILDKKEKYFFYFLVFLSILVMLLEIIGLSLIIPIISLILSDDIIYKFPGLFEKISFFIEIEKNNLLQFFTILFVLFILIKNIFIFFYLFLQNLFVKNFDRKLAKKLFGTYLNMPYYKLFEGSSGTLVNNINVVVPTIGSFLLNFLILITEIIIILGLITFFLIKQPVSTFILCLVFGLSSFIYYLFFKKKFKIWGRERVINSALSNKILLQAFSAKKDLRVNDIQDYFLDKYSKYNFVSILNIYLIRLFSSTPKLFLEILGVMVLGLLIQLYVLDNKINNDLVIDMSLYVFGLVKILPSISKILNNFSTIKSGSTAINIVYKDLSQDYLKGQKNKNNLKINFNNEINFKEINYRYPNTSKHILKNLNFEIKKGEKILICGESGQGKSTFLDLLLGLINPSRGQVLVDGVNIKKNFKNWRKKIGYVPQDIYLFDDDIKKNIAIGLETNEIDLNKVRKALKKSSLNKYLKNNNKKNINMIVGEDGINLSGGQKQRIAIARAIYKTSNLLIFDEATSGLDKQTEMKIVKDILKLGKDTTIIFVTHRTYLNKYFDKMYELKNKKLILKNEK
tara:strand:- start:1674 stop:3407 length:1734 start_codon:yes stop_codon:yes gene_type:complete